MTFHFNRKCSYLQVTLRPHSAFHNEARIDVTLASRWSANFPQTESMSPVTAGFQLIPFNHRISAEHSKDSSFCIQYYGPCKKNPTDKFEPEDGPLMPVRYILKVARNNFVNLPKRLLSSSK